MVVATPEGFDKKSYRTFNIKNSEITNDDFAMMKEVLTRRFNRMAPENRPDVILLDGGGAGFGWVLFRADPFLLARIPLLFYIVMCYWHKIVLHNFRFYRNSHLYLLGLDLPCWRLRLQNYRSYAKAKTI